MPMNRYHFRYILILLTSTFAFSDSVLKEIQVPYEEIPISHQSSTFLTIQEALLYDTPYYELSSLIQVQLMASHQVSYSKSLNKAFSSV